MNDVPAVTVPLQPAQASPVRINSLLTEGVIDAEHFMLLLPLPVVVLAVEAQFLSKGETVRLPAAFKALHPRYVDAVAILHVTVSVVAVLLMAYHWQFEFPLELNATVEPICVNELPMVSVGELQVAELL